MSMSGPRGCSGWCWLHILALESARYSFRPEVSVLAGRHSPRHTRPYQWNSLLKKLPFLGCLCDFTALEVWTLSGHAYPFPAAAGPMGWCMPVSVLAGPGQATAARWSAAAPVRTPARPRSPPAPVGARSGWSPSTGWCEVVGTTKLLRATGHSSKRPAPNAPTPISGAGASRRAARLSCSDRVRMPCTSASTTLLRISAAERGRRGDPAPAPSGAAKVTEARRVLRAFPELFFSGDAGVVGKGSGTGPASSNPNPFSCSSGSVANCARL
ncbi:hypothetical protein F751_2481 [Auxenochlorella protothecoides]|uniref:Uncharacterized protein n=1 Tax=Auxenochlorella protothecoides TaxID=3075 RepID=A0A087SIT5_AUXPR|nr:hypothetical protein F751_2481 [Auxenochlorella protothecoides]KFM25639.1 hypothetical protein F751_2481 [Auxenochlorella protothecoides]